MSRYLYIFIYIYIYIECHSKCGECSGPLESDCLSCIWGLFPLAILRGGKTEIICVECEKVSGYLSMVDTKSNKIICIEICGDGVNLGEHRCDDGNTVSGDGCSSECQIEQGYICTGGSSTSADKCWDITPPMLTLIPNPQSTLVNHFQLSKPLKLNHPNLDPKLFIKLTIKGKFLAYSFDYEIYFIQDKNNLNKQSRELSDSEEKFYTQIIINLIPKSSIQNDDVFTIYV